MGRILCEAHRMRDLEAEERFLRELEHDVDAYVGQVVSAKGEVLYQDDQDTGAKQLLLFEEMGEYLARRRAEPADARQAD